MPPKTISAAKISKIFKLRLEGDPPPDWIITDRIKLKEFAKIELGLRKREIEIEMERINELQRLM